MELITKELKMTSLDVAKIANKEHKNVISDIRDEIAKLKEKGQLIFQPTFYKDSFNRQQPMFEFGRDGAMQLAMKYSSVTRRKVIIKLEELENSFYGKDIKINGRITTAMSLFLGHYLAHICKSVSIFDPKENNYLLVIKH